MSLLSHWLNQHALSLKSISSAKNVFLGQKPFSSFEFQHFLKEEKVKQILPALKREPFVFKNSDLYSFFQTDDLRGTKNKVLLKFRSLLCSQEFVSLMSEITRIPLQYGIVDLAGTLYTSTNYLLPHDDRVEKRKVAFIYYLSTLTKKDGGALAFYGSRRGQPTVIERRLSPVRNSFVFFEVSTKSFHEVEEVLTNTKRYALSGWFYGP